MLPKRHRAGREEIRATQKRGRKVGGRNTPISLTYQKRKERENTFTFIVPSKVFKSAVGRNLFKRRARYIIKKHLPSIKKETSFVFYFGKGAEKLTFLELESSLISLLKKEKVYEKNIN